MREYEGQVEFVGIAGRDSTGPMNDFVDRHSLQAMTHAVDTDGSLWGRFGVAYQPAWVFFRANGEATQVFGPLGEQGLREILTDMLAG